MSLAYISESSACSFDRVSGEPKIIHFWISKHRFHLFVFAPSPAFPLEIVKSLEKGVRLFAAAQEGVEGENEQKGEATTVGGRKGEAVDREAELEGNYTPEELEFIKKFYAEYEAAEEPQPGEAELDVYSHDYKMYAGEGGSLEIEWDAAVGKVDCWNLPSYEEFDPKVGRCCVDNCCTALF